MAVIRIIINAYGTEIAIVTTLILLGFFMGTVIHGVVDNIGKSKNPFSIRASCESCGRRDGILELLPMIGIFMSFRRCDNCHSKRSKNSVLYGLVIASLWLYAYASMFHTFSLFFVFWLIMFMLFFSALAQKAVVFPTTIVILFGLMGISKNIYDTMHTFLYDTKAFVIGTLIAVLIAFILYFLIKHVLKRHIDPLDPVIGVITVMYIGLPAMIFAVFTALLIKAVFMGVTSVVHQERVEENISMTTYLSLSILIALFAGDEFVRILVDTLI